MRAVVLGPKPKGVETVKRFERYCWPAITAFLVMVPLYVFRHEDSVLHVAFRVAWSVVLILCLADIARQAYRDLQKRGASRPQPPAARAQGVSR